jgi:hypothetical protein
MKPDPADQLRAYRELRRLREDLLEAGLLPPLDVMAALDSMSDKGVDQAIGYAQGLERLPSFRRH